jgi:hypothetical protein
MTFRSLAAAVCMALAVIVAAPAGTLAQAQPSAAAADTLVALTLLDGSRHVGRVVAETETAITFETTAGLRFEVTRDRIRSLAPVEGRVVDGELWPNDPNRTRLLLLSPTARTIPQGAGYVSAFWVVFPFVAYGVTDAFTVAAGTPVIPQVIGRVVYVAPKLRVVHSPTMDVAVGTLALFATEEIDQGSVGIAYGVATYGDAAGDNAITAGAGWGWALGRGDAWLSNDPLLMVGGEFRVGRTVKLVTENFFVPTESVGLVSGGVRLFGERLSVDAGLAAPVGHGWDFTWFPVLNFVYNFGRH